MLLLLGLRNNIFSANPLYSMNPNYHQHLRYQIKFRTVYLFPTQRDAP
jgi:hypothetical protein